MSKKILMFLPTIHIKPTFVQEVNFSLMEEFAYDFVGTVTSVKSESGGGGVYNGAPIYFWEDAAKIEADMLLFPKVFWFGGFDFMEHFNKLANFFPREKIFFDDTLMKEFLSLKYADSKDTEIQATLSYLQNHNLEIFNQYLDIYPDTFDEVFVDQNYNLPYIFFETASGKRLKMYYPREQTFAFTDGKPYVKNILKEQLPTSPHLYVTDSHRPMEGDVIIDAGVCEGNFALKYIDIAKKIYLFENDKKWLEPLYRTFSQGNTEIILTTKGVGDISNDSTEKIDNIVDFSDKSQNYFLKMDIEGYEIKALKGAENLLKTGRVTSSICVYHKTYDDILIKRLLENYGYKTSFAKGYMTMVYTEEFWRNRDIRHGVIYGDK